MATQNSIDNTSNPLASTAVTVDPGASGDSYVQFDINTTGEFRMGVDDTDDSFRISQGSALGTNDTFIMTAAGERTMPLQPAFLAYLATDDLNQTGDGTIYTLGGVTALTEIFDQGGDFNTNGTFTAPVTGRYWLYSVISTTGITAAETNALTQIVTSNRTYQQGVVGADKAFVASTGGYTFYSMTVADMDASDTATFVVRLLNGTKVVDIQGSATVRTECGGYLIA